MEMLFSLYPLNWTSILCAGISGAIIGFERQVLGKPVGIRTSMLICIGTYIFIAISNTYVAAATDPSRIIGQVVTGIGFLGAGVMLTRDGVVIGVTSASAIWILASIGVIIGSGYDLTGVKVAVLAVLILVGIDTLEHLVVFLQKGVHRVVKKRKPASKSQGE